MIHATLCLKSNSSDFQVVFKTNSQEITGSLPNSEMQKQYENWVLGMRSGFERGMTKAKPSKAQLNQQKSEKSAEYGNSFNQWIASPSFYVIRDEIEYIQKTQGGLHLTIQTDITWMWQLPWHLWKPFSENSEFIVSFALPEIRPIAKSNLARTKNKVRILAILGDRTKIDISPDFKTLESLQSEQIEVEFLGKDYNLTRKELYEHLWDETGWDMLFFAGHSNTDWLSSQDGFIRISPTESISISELQRAMKWAIALGLQVAIFNSCDGVGLAQGLLRLGIPYAIVMSQPVPDQVAGKFVELFFQEFKQGQTLHSSVHNARYKLSEQTESTFPSASWLPIICQSPITESITFNDLKTNSENNSSWESCSQLLLSFSILERLKKNIFVNDYKKGMELEDIYIPVLLAKQERKENEDISSYQTTKNLEQEQFLKEAIKFGRNISRGSRITLIGDAGMGKSMFLQRIGDWIASELGGVIVFISLASLKSGQSLEDFLANQWLTDAKQQVKLPAQKLSEATNVWLLLDGVDEMPIDGSPLKQINEYVKNSTWISKAKIILTCRTNIWESYRQDFNEFDIYQLQDLSQGGRVEPFVLRWFANNQEDGKALLQQIQGSNVFKELVHNPLQLSLVCAVFEQDRELPTIRAELYQRFIDNIYSWKNKTEEGIWRTTLSKIVEFMGQNYDEMSLQQKQTLETAIRVWMEVKPRSEAEEKEKTERVRALLEDNPLNLFLMSDGMADALKRDPVPTNKTELCQKFIDSIQVSINEIDEDRKKELNRKLGKLAMRSLAPRKLGREVGNKWLKFVEQNYHKVSPQLQKSVEIVTRFWIWAGLEDQDTPYRIPHAIANTVLDKDLPLALELGLLQQVGVSGRYNSQQKIYTFFHSSFHTYFAAQRFESDEWEEWFKHDKFYPLHQNGIYKIFDPNWQEVILLWFGRKDIPDTSKEEFLTALLEFRDTFNNDQQEYYYGFYHLQSLSLAARALVEFPKCSKYLAKKIVNELVQLSYSYYNSDSDFYFPSESIYIRAKKALLQTPKEIVVDLMLRKISLCEQSAVKRTIAFDLQRISPSHPKIVEIFLDRFTSLCDQDSSDPNRDLNLSYAQEWLAQSAVDNAKVINTLSTLLDEEPDEKAQSEIATTLGAIAIRREDAAKKGVDKLLQIHANTYDQNRPYYLGDSLEPIVASNPKIKSYVIEQLVEHLKDPSKLNYYQREERIIVIAESILRIAPTNPLGAETLVNQALASNEYHKLSTKVAIEKLGKAAKGTLNSELTGFELITNSAKIKMAIANTINRATANLDPNNTEDDKDLIWDKLLEILQEVALGDDATIDIITKQLEKAEKPYKRMYLAKCLGKIDLGNTSAIVALLELVNPHNQLYDFMREGMRVDQARCYAVQFLAEIDFNPTRAINILLNLLQELTERWQYTLLESGISDEELKKGDFYPSYRFLGNFMPPFSMVLEQLGKLGSNNLRVIQALTEFLDVPKPISKQVDTAYHLANIDVGNYEGLGTLMNIYDDEGWKDVQRWIINLARNYADKGGAENRPQIMIDAVKKLLNNAKDESEKMRYAEALGRIDSGSIEYFNEDWMKNVPKWSPNLAVAFVALPKLNQIHNKLAIDTLIDILKTTDKMHLSNPREALVKILQGDGARPACMEIVSTQRKYLEEIELEDYDRYQEWLEIFFHCSEILTYQEFYKAWHQDDYVFPKPQARKLIWLLIAPLTSLVSLIALYWRQPLLLPLDKLYELIKFTMRKIKKWLY